MVWTWIRRKLALYQIKRNLKKELKAAPKEMKEIFSQLYSDLKRIVAEDRKYLEDMLKQIKIYKKYEKDEKSPVSHALVHTLMSYYRKKNIIEGSLEHTAQGIPGKPYPVDLVIAAIYTGELFSYGLSTVDAVLKAYAEDIRQHPTYPLVKNILERKIKELAELKAWIDIVEVAKEVGINPYKKFKDSSSEEAAKLLIGLEERKNKYLQEYRKYF